MEHRHDLFENHSDRRVFSLLAAPAFAGDWTNSGMYNGYGASSQNTPANFSMRDGNGNLTMVNGQVTSANYSSNSGGGALGSPSETTITCFCPARTFFISDSRVCLTAISARSRTMVSTSRPT